MNKGLSTYCYLLIISISLLACGEKEKWYTLLHSNSDSLIRLKSQKNQSLLNRGEKILVYDADLAGIGFPKKLDMSYRFKWSMLSTDIPGVISELRNIMTNQSVSADDYIPKYQIILLDASGVIIGHWRLRMNPEKSDEFAIIFPTGGMYKVKDISDFRRVYMSIDSAEK